MSEEYSYSVEKVEFALLNKDGSFPTPSDWTHTPRKSATAVTHKGGLIGGTGPWDLSGLSGDELKLTPIYGKNTLAQVTVSLSGAVSQTAVTAGEVAAALNTALAATEFDASVCTVGATYDAAYLKVIDGASSNKLPWYAPFGLHGKLAEICGITGWYSSDNLKSSAAEPNIETGDTVSATAGTGVKCSLKEPDSVTGKKLTITLAADEDEIVSIVMGDDYDIDTGTYFERGSSVEPPVFCYRVWSAKYAAGTNVKGSQTKMKVRCFPACTATPGSSTDEEAAFATTEITADCAANSVSTMPIEFKQTIAQTDFANYVSA